MNGKGEPAALPAAVDEPNPGQVNGQEDARVSGYELFVIGLCIYVLIALAVDAFFKLSPETRTVLMYVDTAICVFFIVDFFYQLFSAERKLEYLKWGWIDLASSIPMVDFLRWGRSGRIFRVLRVLRAIRSTKRLVAYVLTHRAQSAFSAAALVSVLFVIFGSIAILQFEEHADANIRTPGDALWWSFVTITTVGYGDKYPITTEGRVVAAVLMVAGVGLFGTFTGFVAAWFLEEDDEQEVGELAQLREELAEIRQLVQKLAAREDDAQFVSADPEDDSGTPE